MRLVNTSTTSPFNLFSSVVTCKIYFLSNFKLHNTVLLTIVTMLSIWFPELHLITRILYPLINISPFLSLPSPRQPPFYSPLLWVHRVLFKLLTWDTRPSTLTYAVFSLIGHWTQFFLYLMLTAKYPKFSKCSHCCFPPLYPDSYDSPSWAHTTTTWWWKLDLSLGLAQASLSPRTGILTPRGPCSCQPAHPSWPGCIPHVLPPQRLLSFATLVALVTLSSTLDMLLEGMNHVY